MHFGRKQDFLICLQNRAFLPLQTAFGYSRTVRWTAGTNFARFRIAFLALGVIATFLTGCGDRTQNPVRVLAPSIRTEDLVRWMNDAAIDCKSIDWSAVNAVHDAYLNQILADRIIARERIDQLFHKVDLQQETTPEENLRINKAALGINRDFSIQLAGQDAFFLNALADTRGLNHSITGYLLARRNMQRTARLFQIASIPNSLTTQFPIPAYMVFATWPSDAPRSTDEIIAWTMRISPQLSIPADHWWDATAWSAPAILEVLVPPRHAAWDPETQKIENEKRIAVINAKTRAKAVEYMRAVFAVLDQDALGIPAAARETARMQTLANMTRIPEYAQTLRALTFAEDSQQLSPAIREQVKKIRITWFAAQAAILRKYLEDTSPQVKAAALAYEQLQSLIPKENAYQSLRNQIRAVYKDAPAAVTEPVIESEKVAFYSSAQEYKNWMGLGLIAAAPSRETLRSISRIANLDAQQEAIFVDDARNEWHKLLEVANNRIAEAQIRVNESGRELIENPGALDKAVKMVLRECVNSTNQSAQKLDKRIAENLTSQASVLGGQIEPAATLWRVLRRYPTKDRAVDPNFGQKGLRCFQSIAPASIAVLAIDRDLSIETRQVLIDLIVVHAEELIAAADDTEIARNTAVDRIFRALAMQHDPDKGKSMFEQAIRDFRIVNDRWGNLQQSLVDQAADILPANDAHALRYRRAQLLVPELFFGGSTPFALDRSLAFTRAGELLGANDRALALTLEMDDLALLDSINKRLALDPTAQPSSEELTALYKSDETLAEQSMRRIDRASRAQLLAKDQRP